MDELTDEALLRACIGGPRAAWDAFVDRFSRYVYYLVQLTARRLGAAISGDQADDLHNDVFVSLMEDDCRRLRAFEGRNGCSARSWIRVITVRRTVDHFRRGRVHLSLDADREHSAVPEPIDAGADALEVLLEREDDARRARLGELAAALSERDRLLLHLLFEQRLSADAAAAALRISKGALYTRKTRLIQRLRGEAERAGLLDAGTK